jgi:hypothetical protein
VNRHLHKAIALSAIIAAMILSSACSQSGSSALPSQAPSDNNDQGTDDPVVTPGPVTPYKPVALLWETSAKPERTKWSAYLQNIILNRWNTLLQGADDMDIFCPNFDNLSNEERANAWAALFVGVAKFESAFDNTMRFHESTMGTDSVTKQPVYSEGLLQLSYQDIKGYSFCDFDWNVDSKLSKTDPKKTIFDPYKNLECGVGIMSRQLARSGQITVSSNAYWSTLRSGGTYNKISKIAAIVKAMPFCTKK